MAVPDSTGTDNFFERDQPDIFGDTASKIKLFSVTLDGVVTDFAVSDYVNQLFIIITQFQKIGTLVTVSKASVGNLNGCDGIYEIKTICGLDSQECQLAARFLTNQLNIGKPVLFAINLTDYQPKVLKAIVEVLQENL